MKIKSFNKAIISLALAMGALSAPTAEAKTAKWSVEPIYNNIEMMSPGIFLVKRGVYSSIIDGSGNEIVPSTTDSITPFIEGESLILTPAEGDRYRLQGILHADFTKTPVAEEVYVSEYPFFSEGLLPVCNSQGFYGYMDPTGRMVLPTRYTNPHPFSEGRAVVTERMKGALGNIVSKVTDKAQEIAKRKAAMLYINRAGVALKLPKEIGKVYNGTTFCNGTAYIENNKGEFFTINANGSILSRGEIKEFEVDDHYRLADSERQVSETSASTAPSSSVDDVVSFTVNNLTGYRTKAGSTVLPPQFSDAEEFVGEFALAKHGGKWGILKLGDGTFSGKAEKVTTSKTRARKGKKAAPAPSPKYIITTPQSWANTSLTLTLKEGGENKSETVEGTGADQRTYAMAIPSGNGLLTLHTPNLVLWECNLSSAATEEVPSAPAPGRLRISISPASAKADVRDNAAITVTLTNSGSTEITTTVKVSGTGLIPVNRSITVPGNSSRRVNTAFTNVLEKEFRTVNVTAGGRSASKTITVNPFYVKY
ncbi:MAG: WG repeat-containing protein [Pseudoflavonifractor sp.]|nr:WG repeat-containing protein [Alloprevotella sp.]MCM1116860.1 WG repeat-containing protein [Pseudoflavonifractor sp.]